LCFALGRVAAVYLDMIERCGFTGSVRTCIMTLVGVLLCSAGASAQPVIDRKVLIIGVDGMRPDAMLAANTPAFDGLIAQGAFSERCMAEDITISGPCWSSILCGVHRNKHLVVNNSFAATNYDAYPHFIERLEGLCDVQTASLAHWGPVNTNILRGNADTVLSNVSDDAVAAAAVSELSDADLDVIFLHFDNVDAAGHANGFSPTIPAYLAAIEATDTRVGLVLAALEARPTIANEDWLIIVTSDHGGTPDGSHGRNIPEHRYTPLIVSGAASAVGSIITPDPELVDIKATVLTFLGFTVDPTWGLDGQAVGLAMANTTSRPFICVPPPPPIVGACCLANGDCTVLEESACLEVRGVWAGAATDCSTSACAVRQTLFSEDFSSVVLGPNVNETLAGTAVWSANFPTGWIVDRSAMPSGGVTEWRGWSVADRPWWAQAAQDQGRSGFTKATGAAAIADPDEWFDLATGPGTFRSSIVTPAINISSADPSDVRVYFDSSWRPENSQRARLTAEFNTGNPVTILEWTSQPGANFKPDATNETVGYLVAPPSGANSMRLRFELLDAGNNWWWAVDNIQVRAATLPRRLVLLRENFDSVPLGPNVNESLAGERVWSGVPPQGWSFDDSGVAGINDPARGMTEWKGWAITSRPWWVSIAGDQGRSGFTRGTNAIAVADPDEWDDRGAPTQLGTFNGRMSSAAVSLEGVSTEELTLTFDSSWRFEGQQRAVLTATFDNGAPLQLLRWDSAPGPFQTPDDTNENVTITFDAPENATSVMFTFALTDALNNWWWAVDNITLTGTQLPPACIGDFNQDGGVDGSDIEAFFVSWGNGDSIADINADGGVDGSDVEAFFFAWTTGC
jgi:hypothetical protein